MVKQTLSSALDLNLPAITSLNLMDQESAKKKAHTLFPTKGLTYKVCSQSFKKDCNPVREDRGRTAVGFPDCVYFHAAAIFQNSNAQKDLVHRFIHYGPVPPSADGDSAGVVAGGHTSTRQKEYWAYELAFNTLKYQDLLEEILIDSCFYPSQQPNDLMALVMVTLYDLLDRKFQSRDSIRRAETGLIPEVRQVEGSLHRFRTKLEASLAHCRIKKNLLNIDNFLPQSVREKQRRTVTLPLYTWVNTLKASVEDVCEILRTAGFTQVDGHTHLVGSVFCKDTHCPNVLLFPRRAKTQLEKSRLVTENTLIIQDKSRSLVACAARLLLVEDCDILMVGSFSALTVAHIAIQAVACSGSVHVCGVRDVPTFKEEFQETLSAIGCKNVKLLSDDFADLNEHDLRIQKVQMVVLLPQCSVSALSNPVEFILNENGDRGLLNDLSQGTISDSKLEVLVAKQTEYLNHALTFTKVKTVIYCTCSVHPEENEGLLQRTLEKADIKPKALPFRMVSTGWSEEKETFFRIEASNFTNGCFLCVLKREDPAEVETVQDILARAAAKGLLGGLMPPDLLNGEKPKKRKKQNRIPLALPTSSLIDPTASVMTRLTPPVDRLMTSNISQTATIPVHTSVLNHNSNVKSQLFADVNGTSSIINQPSTIQHSEIDRGGTKVVKQSRRKKASKSRTRKDCRSKIRPPRKRLLRLQTFQQTTVHSIKTSSPRTPVPPYEPRYVNSRGRSHQDQEVINPKKELVRLEQEARRLKKDSREFTLPPVFQLSRSHLSSSSSLPRLCSSTSSNISNSLSSSNSFAKGREYIVSHSRPWH